MISFSSKEWNLPLVLGRDLTFQATENVRINQMGPVNHLAKSQTHRKADLANVILQVGKMISPLMR